MPKSVLFERLVGDSDDPKRLVAYGLYKKAKAEWIADFEAENARPPTSDELKAYTSSWTSQLVSTTLEAAEGALAAFADEAIEEARPEILKDALKGSSFRAVMLGILSAFLYTLILIGVALALKSAGVDLLSIVGSVGS